VKATDKLAKALDADPASPVELRIVVKQAQALQPPVDETLLARAERLLEKLDNDNEPPAPAPA